MRIEFTPLNTLDDILSAAEAGEMVIPKEGVMGMFDSYIIRRGNSNKVS